MFCCNKIEDLANIQILLHLIFILPLLPNTDCAKGYIREMLLMTNMSGIELCNLNIHRESNTIFFCFNKPRNYDSKIAYYNIDTRETDYISGILKGCPNAVDQDTGTVYLGGSKGIYKYDLQYKAIDSVIESNVHISSLFFHKRLYYVRYPDRKVFVEYGGQFYHISEFIGLKIDHFHVSQDGKIYFSVKNRIYIFDRNTTHWDLKELNSHLKVNAIAEDNNGVMYLCTDLGVFTVVGNEVQKFMAERNIVGMTADKDNNLIVVDDKRIYKLRDETNQNKKTFIFYETKQDDGNKS